MKLIFSVGLLFFFSEVIFADTIIPSSDHVLMLQILKERKDKFSSYTQSLDDATGIFGIKSKKDLKNSQKYLVEIVRLDNRLIDVLNRRVDYKGFETVNLNYKQEEADRKVEEMKYAMQSSDKRIYQLNKTIEEQNSTIHNRTLMCFFFGGLFLLTLIKSLRKSSSKT